MRRIGMQDGGALAERVEVATREETRVVSSSIAARSALVSRRRRVARSTIVSTGASASASTYGRIISRSL